MESKEALAEAIRLYLRELETMEVPERIIPTEYPPYVEAAGKLARAVRDLRRLHPGWSKNDPALVNDVGEAERLLHILERAGVKWETSGGGHGAVTQDSLSN